MSNNQLRGQAMSITELRAQGIIEISTTPAGLLTGHDHSVVPPRTIRIGTAVLPSKAWNWMTDQQGEDEAFAADMLLLDELVDELGLDRWPGDSRPSSKSATSRTRAFSRSVMGCSPSRSPVAASARQPLCSMAPETLAAT